MTNRTNLKKVYIVGSKGIPAAYGGFETFIDKLVTGRQAPLQYVVTGMGDKYKEYDYQGAHCVQFETGKTAAARMLHTLQALRYVLKDATHNNSSSIVYILGCRAGIFLPLFRPFLKKKRVDIFVNPDGAEWKRAKWSLIAKTIVLIFEWLLVKSADLVICDSMAIKDIMRKEFNVPEKKLAFAAYGSDIYSPPAKLPKKVKAAYDNWMHEHEINNKPYFLMVGRFVPENNYELVIREFMASSIDANLVVISNITDGKLKDQLREIGAYNDPRIKLVGTLYDQDVLKHVRAQATGYIHGHEVGGTNPSLLEALGSTDVNLVYDVSFNREVAVNSGLYFNAKHGNLGKVMETALNMNNDERSTMGKKAKSRIRTEYSWPNIVTDYEKLFKK